jgi:murein DD-endopeptidase MepM/ murein hydrolase activator NlpD
MRVLLLRGPLRVLLLIATLASLVLHGIPVQAAEAQLPGGHAGKYVRWFYPSQIAYGPLENGQGNTGTRPAPGAFLTLPFMGPHYITSLFDHCGPNYVVHGSVCRYDGTIASARHGGPDPTFSAGYAQTPGGQDYLDYSGHDGYDYGLYYEPVAAAASGTVMLVGWIVPGCHKCLSGLTIEINHGNGLLSYYGHLSDIKVRKGQYVRRGQVIGISGSTGNTTGPHLHFGIYHINGAGPVDPYGWSGAGPDPYAGDVGDLWLTGSPRFAGIPMPHVNVSAAVEKRDPTAVDVSWSSPGGGNVFDVYMVQSDGTMTVLASRARAGSATVLGWHGDTYWFWVSVTTDLGWTDASGSPVVVLPSKISMQVQ